MEIYIKVKEKGKTEIMNYGDGVITGNGGMYGKIKDNKRNDIRIESE